MGCLVLFIAAPFVLFLMVLFPPLEIVLALVIFAGLMIDKHKDENNS